MVEINPADFQKIWEKVKEEIEKLKTFDVEIKISIVGFAKAGKSSLFNAIFGEKIQETGAQTDLTTQDKSKSKFGLLFTDTRGFGTQLVKLEEIKNCLEGQNLIIHCINGMSAITEEDQKLYSFLKETSKPIITVVTKADVMKPREIEEFKKSIMVKLPEIAEHIFISSDTGLTQRGAPIFISAETGLNMGELIEQIHMALPEAARDSFIAKQNADQSIKKVKARATIHTCAIAAAVVATSPIPISDILIIAPLQAGMAATIGKIFGYDITFARAKELLAVAGSGILLRYGFQVLVKLLPGYGSIIGPAIAYGGTVALGEAAILYFASGMKATEKEIADVYKITKEKAEQEFKDQDMEKRIFIIKVGENAGKIYGFLRGKNQVTTENIAKGTDLTQEEVDRAIGWLGREGKIRIEENKNEVMITLTE